MAKTTYQSGLDFSADHFQHYKRKPLMRSERFEKSRDDADPEDGDKKIKDITKQKEPEPPRLQFIVRHKATGIYRMNRTGNINASARSLLLLNRTALKVSILKDRKKLGQKTSSLLAIRAFTGVALEDYFNVMAGSPQAWELIDIRPEVKTGKSVPIKTFNEVFLVKHLLDLDPSQAERYHRSRYPGVVVDPSAPRGYVILPYLQDLFVTALNWNTNH